ncbi:MAG TPA: hypothetical protein VKC53_01780 [Patescibacteria group bacterium]|nr:hypothetical protein [Patescibacteria group bacterium]
MTTIPTPIKINAKSGGLVLGYCELAVVGLGENVSAPKILEGSLTGCSCGLEVAVGATLVFGVELGINVFTGVGVVVLGGGVGIGEEASEVGIGVVVGLGVDVEKT